VTWLPDEVIAHLRSVVDEPELPGGRYRLVRRLGTGGMGTVYLADDLSLDRQVAIKVLRETASDEMSLRLEREARTIARLEHPSIVPIHEFGRLADRRPFYVMKYVAGSTLAQAIGAMPARNERLRLFLKLCDVVAFAHDRGVVHRDLKPQNIMVGPFGELYVMDWGIAKVGAEALPGGAPADTGATDHGTILGTPGYMAPEQRDRGGAAVDQRADIHALGRLLAFLLGGDAAAAAPAALRAIVARATAPEPGDRYQTAVELGAEVKRFLDGERVKAHPENALQAAVRFLDRNRFVVYLVAAYIVLRVLVFFLGGR